MQNSAFLALLNLAGECCPGAAGSGRDLDGEHQWRGVGFSLFGQRFVAPVNEVAELLEVPAVTRLPGVQPWVVGVSNVRGRLLPIFDLANFYDEGAGGARRNHRVLVVELDWIYAGLFVEHVYGMQQFSTEDYVADNDESYYKQRLGDCLHGRYQHIDGQWQVYSPASLFKDPRFLSAALY
jgi:twitching motility protein PilI